MAIEHSELQLVWPPALFAAEAAILLADGSNDEETLGWLLAEAFADNRAFQLFSELHRQKSWFVLSAAMTSLGTAAGTPGLGKPAPAADPATELVRELMHSADALPRYRIRRYYSQRHRQQAEAPLLTLPDLKTGFAQLVRELEDVGYFEDAFGSQCSDARDDDPAREGQRRLTTALQCDAPLWPLGLYGKATGIESDWDEDLFFDVVEALHDHVARPRRRYWHDHHREFDYGDYSRRSGQAVYRWRVNELFSRSQVELHLAEHGSDTGFLVQITGDSRDELFDRALTGPDIVDQDSVAHAVTLYRSRGATREDKRSAVLALARTLEHRRELVRTALGRKDEGALFQIANEFDLRHHNTARRGNYDEVFLDWVFWCYLSTVDLTSRLLNQAASRASAEL
ncbi:hypothetical protein [uncultured Modestobacter sp.]|uniref:hypothetical protein n=1 Tax=uncultured Modestobacter sp. TaxID=380048 RepID=UPI002620BFD3|nr:hypothetical protein [uncultured Modestobacter sp.]